jgi:hypothetical protein
VIRSSSASSARENQVQAPVSGRKNHPGQKNLFPSEKMPRAGVIYMTIDCPGLGKCPLMLEDKVLIWQFNHGRGEVLRDICDILASCSTGKNSL